MVKMSQDINTQKWIDGYFAMAKPDWLTNLRSFFRNRIFKEFVNDVDTKILDIGCGPGNYLRHLMGKGYKNVYGVEPSFVNSHEDLKHRIAKGVAYSLPYKDSSFDCIYFFGVIHHLLSIREYEQALNEANRVLRPGGLLILLEPNSKLFYDLLYVLSKCLKPVSRFAAGTYDVLVAEKDMLRLFFKCQSSIRPYLSLKNFSVLKNEKRLHQWTLVMKKNLHPSPSIQTK